MIGGREEHDDGRTDATRGTCTHRAAEHGLCDLAGLGVEDADMSHGPCPVPVVHMHVGVAGPEEEREVEQSAQSEEAQVLPGASERAREGAEGGGWGGGGCYEEHRPTRAEPRICSFVQLPLTPAPAHSPTRPPLRPLTSKRSLSCEAKRQCSPSTPAMTVTVMLVTNMVKGLKKQSAVRVMFRLLLTSKMMVKNHCRVGGGDGG